MTDSGKSRTFSFPVAGIKVRISEPSELGKLPKWVRIALSTGGVTSFFGQPMELTAVEDEGLGGLSGEGGVDAEYDQCVVADGYLLLDGDDVPPELDSTPLMSRRPVAVIPADHRFAAQDEVSADDLRSERFVAMRAGYLMHRFAHRLFGAELPAHWHATDGAEMGKLMVAEGIGLAVLPDYSVLGDPLARAGFIVTRPIAADQTRITLVAVHRREQRNSAIVADFLARLVSEARTAPGSARSSEGRRGSLPPAP